MSIKKHILGFLIAIGFAVASCAPAYVSNVRNTPMFSKAKEFAGGASYGPSGIDVQLALSVTDHIAIMANGNMLNNDVLLNDVLPYTRRQLFGEAGVGYFVQRERVHFEIFGGFGMAEFKSYETSILNAQDKTTEGAYNRVFIQPSIGLGRTDGRLILSSRVSVVDFISYTATEVGTGRIETRSFKRQGFFEPALTTRLSLYRNLYGFFQGGINIPINFTPDYDFNALQFSVGLQLRTSPKKKNDN